jgi:hypothetical protein
MPRKRTSNKRPSQSRESAPKGTREASVAKLKSLIRNKHGFLDERLAPKVDQGLLLSLVRRELPERTTRDVYRFVHLFKSWNDAYCGLLVQEFRAARRHTEGMR